MTIQNLQFKADSAELLPGEEKRLDQIAEILRLAEGAQMLFDFVVESLAAEELAPAA